MYAIRSYYEMAFLRLRYKLPGEDESRLIEQPVDAAMIRSAAEALALCEREHPLVGLVLLDMAPDSAVFAEIES